MAIIRLFIALKVEELQPKIAQFLEELKMLKGKISWVPLENVHLTLKFLGETEESKVARIIKTLKSTAKSYPPFKVTLKETGSFPSLNNPKVLWIGVKDETETLINLAKEIENKMVSLDYPLEKRGFKPHITLARIKFLSEPNKFKTLLEKYLQINIGEQQIKYFSLMKSTLKPSGAVYEELERFYLKGGKKDGLAEF